MADVVDYTSGWHWAGFVTHSDQLEREACGFKGKPYFLSADLGTGLKRSVQAPFQSPIANHPGR